MGYISQDDLVADMTPEQKILVQQFYSKFDDRSAANRKIVNVEPLFFQGAFAGSEFLTYAATKLYIAFEVDVYTNNTVTSLNATINYFTNENNTVSIQGFNSIQSTYWDATAILAKTMFGSNNEFYKNIYFARVLFGANYAYMKFIGYRITLI